MRLSGVDNEPLGIVSLAEAFRLAEEANVDLVEIAPTAQPPVCRLMDYGKFKYSEQKKAHEAKLKQKIILVKEVKFRPGTDDGDYNIKLRNLIKFLEDGDKTKITLRFRGREMAHQDIGFRMLERLKADLEPYGQVEQFPKMEGRQMIMRFTVGGHSACQHWRGVKPQAEFARPAQQCAGRVNCSGLASAAQHVKAGI
eukprot:gene18549-22188_t